MVVEFREASREKERRVVVLRRDGAEEGVKEKGDKSRKNISAAATASTAVITSAQTRWISCRSASSRLCYPTPLVARHRSCGGGRERRI